MSSIKKFYRSRNDKMIAGICSGLGKYFEVDPNLFRFTFVVMAIFTAVLPFIIIYLVAWIIFPER